MELFERLETEMQTVFVAGLLWLSVAARGQVVGLSGHAADLTAEAHFVE